MLSRKHSSKDGEVKKTKQKKKRVDVLLDNPSLNTWLSTLMCLYLPKVEAGEPPKPNGFVLWV